ncbi:MAG: hypothetical protein V7647_3849 [Acidobacteriota bacterium]|jgi:hypothetical protein
MALLHVLTLLLLLGFGGLRQDAARRPDCRSVDECRQAALAAATREDFETFHDLAWRAVQLGPKNDPALMYMLARAQSLSGRPNDAIVMLERLAAMGVPVDAATNDDFRRVRALPRWPELASKIGPAARAGDAPTVQPLTPPDAGERPRPALDSPPPAVESRPSAPSGGPPLEPLRFTTPRFTPAGLAYDAVSRRFVVGDRQGRKLAVVDEFSQHVANLAGAQTSGFGEIAAIEIDARQGDLWVVSSEGPRTSLHKLQLISGRLLATYPVPEQLSPVSLGDVAVAGWGGVLALDTAGHRLFRLSPRAAAPEIVATLPDTGPVSIAPAENGVVFVATASGLSRLDMTARSTVAVKAAPGVDLGGLTRIRWHAGALAGLQKAAEGAYRAVSISVDRRGRTATAIDVLDPRISISNPTAATVVGRILYYLANGEGSEMIVRRVTLP